MKDEKEQAGFFSKERRQMVEHDLAGRGIKDAAVLEAFRKVPREYFVPGESRRQAYGDHPLPIECGQTISQPYIVALMLQALKLTGKEKVLEIGTGSGYQTALLAELARVVYSVDKFPELVRETTRKIDRLGYENIRLKAADGRFGWPEYAPYDAILVSAAARKVPEALIGQLAGNGRLIMPLGERWAQTLTLYEKSGEKLARRNLGGCVFVPLLGGENGLDRD